MDDDPESSRDPRSRSDDNAPVPSSPINNHSSDNEILDQDFEVLSDAHAKDHSEFYIERSPMRSQHDSFGNPTKDAELEDVIFP